MNMLTSIKALLFATPVKGGAKGEAAPVGSAPDFAQLLNAVGVAPAGPAPLAQPIGSVPAIANDIDAIENKVEYVPAKMQEWPPVLAHATPSPPADAMPERQETLSTVSLAVSVAAEEPSLPEAPSGRPAATVAAKTMVSAADTDVPDQADADLVASPAAVVVAPAEAAGHRPAIRSEQASPPVKVHPHRPQAYAPLSLPADLPIARDGDEADPAEEGPTLAQDDGALSVQPATIAMAAAATMAANPMAPVADHGSPEQSDQAAVSNTPPIVGAPAVTPDHRAPIQPEPASAPVNVHPDRPATPASRTLPADLSVVSNTHEPALAKGASPIVQDDNVAFDPSAAMAMAPAGHRPNQDGPAPARGASSSAPDHIALRPAPSSPDRAEGAAIPIAPDMTGSDLQPPSMQSQDVAQPALATAMPISPVTPAPAAPATATLMPASHATAASMSPVTAAPTAPATAIVTPAAPVNPTLQPAPTPSVIAAVSAVPVAVASAPAPGTEAAVEQVPDILPTPTGEPSLPAKPHAQAVSLLQLVRDHMSVRGPRRAEAAAPVQDSAVDRDPVILPPVAKDSVMPTTPLVQPATQSVMTPAAPAIPTVDLSASLGAQMVDMGVSGQWIDGLARDIAGLSANGAQGRFQIDANHLGPVTVDIRQGDDGAAISLTVATEAAEQALRREGDRLKLDAGLAAVRISDVKIERTSHVAESARSDTTGNQNGSQQQSGGQPQNQNQSAGQGMGQSSAQSHMHGRDQNREKFAWGHKAGSDGTVLNHVDAGDIADAAIRARYA